MLDVDSFFVLGLDGGGTKVEAVLLDQDGVIVGCGIGGPANSVFVGREVARNSVANAFSAALVQVPDIKLLAAAGSSQMIRMQMDELLQESGFRGEFFFFSEGEIAFRRADLTVRRGIAIIAGTGSAFAAYNDNRYLGGLGGWGAMVGDEGSGFDIGLKAIKAAGRARDGRGPGTALVDMVMEYAQVQEFWQVLSKYCRPCPKQYEIAGFSKLVTTAAKSGDEVALRILSEAGKSLADDAAHLASMHFGPDEEFDVVPAGGVFNAGDFVLVPLEERIHEKFPNAKIRFPVIGPGEAVARLTMESCAK